MCPLSDCFYFPCPISWKFLENVFHQREEREKRGRLAIQVTGCAPEREGIVFPVQQCMPSQIGRQLPGCGQSRLDRGARAPNRQSWWATAPV